MHTYRDVIYLLKQNDACDVESLAYRFAIDGMCTVYLHVSF